MTVAPGLATARVAFLGLGLMGGSLALALRGKVSNTLAYDPNPETLRLALEMGAVDQISDYPGQILPQADVILLCAPVSAILSWIEKLPSLHPGRVIVLDIGSTKEQICTALESLPERFDPLGGHPMCGKAVAGLEHAEPFLFQGAKFAFTPLERTSPKARSLAVEIASAIGADPLWIDPHTHDRWVAATSHLPYLISCALSLTTPVEAAPLVGPGFRSTSRLATSSLAMMADILSTNRSNVLAALERFSAWLALLGGNLSTAGVTPHLIESLREAAIRQGELAGAVHNPDLMEPL